MNYEKEHKELHEKIWNCKCKPYLKINKYCKDCQEEIIKFLNKYGAGVLTNDLKIEELEKKNNKLEKENQSLSQHLQEKIKRVEELKEELTSFQSIKKVEE